MFSNFSLFAPKRPQQPCKVVMDKWVLEEIRDYKLELIKKLPDSGMQAINFKDFKEEDLIDLKSMVLGAWLRHAIQARMSPPNPDEKEQKGVRFPRRRKLIRNVPQQTDQAIADYLQTITLEEFTALILSVKQEPYETEKELYGNGADVNSEEYKILSHTSYLMKVLAYDGGQRYQNQIDVHKKPFSVSLLIVSGAVLNPPHPMKAPKDFLNPDREAILTELGRKVISPTRAKELAERLDVKQGTGDEPLEVLSINPNDLTTYDPYINREALKNRIRASIIPGLIAENEDARVSGEKLILEVSALGCGFFAGVYKGYLAPLVNDILKQLMTEYGGKGLLSELDLVNFDPYDELKFETTMIGHIEYRVDPSKGQEHMKGSLRHPREYGKQYEHHRKIKVVLADMLSIFCNEGLRHSPKMCRASDEPSMFLATDAMTVFTGIEGYYICDKIEYELMHGYFPLPQRMYGGIINPVWDDVLPGNRENIFDMRGCIHVFDGNRLMKLEGDGLILIVPPVYIPFSERHPYVYTFLKYTALLTFCGVIGAVFFFSGGTALIPFLTALSLVESIAATTGILFGLSIVSWATIKLFSYCCCPKDEGGNFQGNVPKSQRTESFVPSIGEGQHYTQNAYNEDYKLILEIDGDHKLIEINETDVNPPNDDLLPQQLTSEFILKN